MKTKLFAIVTTVFLLTGCASIIHGPSQTVEVTSTPSGATVYIDGEDMGKTPRTLTLRRKGRNKGEPKTKKGYALKVELDGYYPYEIKVKRDVDGWFFGNVLFGGIIGIIIDASNGSMYKLNPDQVVAQMNRTTAMNVSEDGKIYIGVTLDPDPTWEKIGELEKVDQ